MMKKVRTRNRSWGVLMDNGIPVPVRIESIIEETPSVRTFVLSREFGFAPGQFVMVWVPGVDEIPMALSSCCSITVQNVGDATSALFQKNPGDLLGIRGPFGKGYPDDGKILAIAGGVGAAPLRPLALAERGLECFFLGARTRSELLFARELSEKVRLLAATDDGTFGYHGPVTGLLSGIDLTGFDRICVCGPEKMMHAVLMHLDREGMAERGYFSLHRYMKCGIGLCGSCCIDPSGSRVCHDGPVFRGDSLLHTEFGQYSRDASGRRKKI
jgi:dihydroorotate dehydrogenase electron transfer subunit